ncbi:MAG: BPSL0067 family protein [Janthinobacterium lividum]|nr:BPSL0067 family protein [Janthinobacterium lividum]
MCQGHVRHSYTLSALGAPRYTELPPHQCVALVRHYAGASATLDWKPGEAVLGNRLLRKGTAIADNCHVYR